MNALAVAQAEPHAGWGKLIALLTAIGICWIGSSIHQRWMIATGRTEATSSLEAQSGAPGGVKPQVKVGSDPTFDPTQKGSPEVVGKRATVGEWILERRAAGVGYRAAIRAAAKKYDISTSTAKRAMQDAQNQAGTSQP